MITGGGSSSSRGGRPSQDIQTVISDDNFPKPVSSILVYFNCILDGSLQKLYSGLQLKPSENAFLVYDR